MDGSAIILTGGLLDAPHGKTAHGLIRGTERYRILAIVDDVSAGKDAGEIVDGQNRGIPVYHTLEEYLQHHGERADYCIVGIASSGGKIPPQLLPVIQDAIRAGISVISGLHEFLSEMPNMVELAEQYNTQLIDVRKPRPRSELHFWSGAIYQVQCPKVVVMGVDCAVGKRTTARFLTKSARRAGWKAEMIYTGQTGWLQGGKYGFIFDSTVNDFVSGELEHAIVSCYREEKPDVIFIEGQAALRNPSGPCGSEFLVSGNAEGVILQVVPSRTHYKGWDHLGLKIPPVSNEIKLVEMYGSQVLGITINTQKISLEEAYEHKVQLKKELGLPVILPVEEGVEELLPAITSIMKTSSP